jgi:hypothetical protein
MFTSLFLYCLGKRDFLVIAHFYQVGHQKGITGSMILSGQKSMESAAAKRHHEGSILRIAEGQ